MHFTTITLLFALLPIIFIVFIAIFIGIYVYRDATRRGMNGALWTIVAVFAPIFIGLIIYLLVRGNYSDLNCPNCDAAVTSEFIVCPKCGVKLKNTCSNCSFPCESTWSVCPKCASSLTENAQDITPPIKKQDKTIGKILIAVIVIPVFLFIVVYILSFSSFGLMSSSSMGTTFMPVEEYVEGMDNPNIDEWVKSCSSEKEVVYALRYDEEKNGEKTTNYALYFPFDSFGDIKTSIESTLFNQYVIVEFGGNPNQSFVNVKYNFLQLSTINSDTFLDLKTTYNGKNIPCTVIDVDYDTFMVDDSDISSTENN